jgi:endonuclease/exonuclease/phosphatase family metal-dependent hydrolase
MTTMQLAGGTFGNAVLSRWPIFDVAEHGLTVGTREPRGALDVTIGRDLRELRVIATHLGLRVFERHEQLARLLAIARDGNELPTVLAGDFNVTRARARELHACAEHFGKVDALATFPSIAPVLPLDRILVAGGVKMTSIAVHRSRRARVASDHLPLVATVEIPD